jgi:DNA-binding GntR family transcriptional regulator
MTADRGGIVLYAQVAAHLRARVIAGALPVGAVFPAETGIMAQYGVSRYTAERAIRLLVDEGLVVRRAGIGSFVARVPQQTTVTAGPGARVSSRMATPAERGIHGLAAGDQVLIVERPGQPDEVHPADRTVIMVSGA